MLEKYTGYHLAEVRVFTLARNIRVIARFHLILVVQKH